MGFRIWRTHRGLRRASLTLERLERRELMTAQAVMPIPFPPHQPIVVNPPTPLPPPKSPIQHPVPLSSGT